MKKLNFLLFLFIPFIFMSCIDPWIDMEVTSCKLNKETYKLNEDIVFTCSGDFDESQGTVGTLALEIAFCKENESEEPKKLNFEIVDSGNLDFDIEFYDDIEHNNETDVPKTYIYFDTLIIDHLPFENFDKKVVFKATEPGNYEAVICFYSSSKQYRYSNHEFYNIQFTVEAE